MSASRKTKLFVFIFAVVFIAANLQSSTLSVRAQVELFYASPEDIGFGLVFYGQEKDDQLLVALDTADELTYEIINSPIESYLNLCPFLLITNDEGEGDTEAFASLNRAEGDTSDLWQVGLRTRPLNGAMTQSGNYACRLEVRAINYNQENGQTSNGVNGSSGSGGFIFTSGPSQEQEIIMPEEPKEEPKIAGEFIVKLPETSLSAGFFSFAGNWFKKLGLIFACTFSLWLPLVLAIEKDSKKELAQKTEF